MQQTVEKKPFKMKAENLYEVVHAIIGQMFLTQIDTIDQLMKDLKTKFPSQSHIMDQNYINPASNRKEDLNLESPNKTKTPVHRREQSRNGQQRVVKVKADEHTNILSINVEGAGFTEKLNYQS
jgi:hypothetical protein